MKVKPAPQPGHVVVDLDRRDPQLLAGSDYRAAPAFALKRILVPMDFSVCAKKALAYALPFARQFGAEITLLHVVQVNYYAGDFGSVDVSILENEMRSAAERSLADLAANDLPPELTCTHLVRTGRVVTEIVNVAKESNADIIILSTHGHTGLKHVLLGSVAENVVRHAPCPVLIVRQQEHEFITP